MEVVSHACIEEEKSGKGKEGKGGKWVLRCKTPVYKSFVGVTEITRVVRCVARSPFWLWTNIGSITSPVLSPSLFFLIVSFHNRAFAEVLRVKWNKDRNLFTRLWSWLGSSEGKAGTLSPVAWPLQIDGPLGLEMVGDTDTNQHAHWHSHARLGHGRIEHSGVVCHWNDTV